MPGTHLFSDPDEIPDSFHNRFIRSAYTVFLIRFLIGSVQGNDQLVETGFYGPPDVFIREKMTVCGGPDIDLFRFCIGDQVEQIPVQVRFPLEIEYQEKQFFPWLVNVNLEFFDVDRSG